MLLAAVIEVEALEQGDLPAATGRLVHGLWFQHWKACCPAVADALHAEEGLRPFTLSPLLGLPRPRHGAIAVTGGDRAWFRVTTLTADLSAQTAQTWLPQLPAEVTLGGAPWRVVGIITDPPAHPWAGCADPQALAETLLLAAEPARQWRLEFATPTAFRGAAGHLPFPLPGALIGSWLRQWETFGPVGLPEDLLDYVQEQVVISSYRLKTVPVRDRRQVTIGCVGQLTLRALRLPRPLRAALELLARYAFWAGSGHRTPQGMGQTRLL